MTHFWVFFNVVHKVLHVLFGSSLIILLIFLALASVMDVLLAHLLHIQALNFPDTLFLSAAHLGVRFLNDNDVGKLMLVSIIEVFKLLCGHLIEIVAKHCVIEVEELAKVSVHNERPIIGPEFVSASQLHLHHTEILASGCTRCGHIKVNILNIEHDEFAEAFSGAER